SKETKVKVNGDSVSNVEPGKYMAIRRIWQEGDRVELDLDFSLRTWVGDEQVYGKASLYRGPLLLAFDTHFNPYDPDKIPSFDLNDLSYSELDTHIGRFNPILLLRFANNVTLCDFATAGASGTHYVSWLPSTNAPPPPIVLKQPADGQAVAAGPTRFEWSGVRWQTDRTYTLTIAENAGMEHPVLTIDKIRYPVRIVNQKLPPGREYYWQVVSHNPHGNRFVTEGAHSFTINASLENPLAAFQDNPALINFREDGLVAKSPLDGNGTPEYGCLLETRNIEPAVDRFGKENGAVRFSGNGMLRYRVPYFPAEEYTFMAWICPETGSEGRLAQIFSAWAKGGDDPLRVVLDKGHLHARIEGFTGANSKGAPVILGEWAHVAVVKTGGKLLFYVNGDLIDSTNASTFLPTAAEDFALGANPHHQGNEFFVGSIDEFAFYAKDLSAEQITAIYREQRKKP
ncbi:MAG: LamG-like jellyroll fold domain-containing protein, partial [bacterium]